VKMCPGCRAPLPNLHDTMHFCNGVTRRPDALIERCQCWVDWSREHFGEMNICKAHGGPRVECRPVNPKVTP
jgi:hypothetical protein